MHVVWISLLPSQLYDISQNLHHLRKNAKMPIESVCIHIAKMAHCAKALVELPNYVQHSICSAYNGLEALRHKDDYHKRTRIVLCRRVGAPATDMRRELNWPTLASRRAVSEAVAVYQSFSGRGPAYLSALF